MDKIFAVGDIHGELALFESLLTHWQPEKERLLSVGDLIDRGPDPGAVVRKAMRLTREHDAIFLRGNHENMLLDWLAEPNEKMMYYISQGGMETIESLLKHKHDAKMTPGELARCVEEEAAAELAFIRERPYYYEWGDFVFVHAGVDLTLADWKETSKHDMVWIREPFQEGTNKTGKTFVVGHTPTEALNPDGSPAIWYNADRSIIDIDGGAVFGGALHGVVIGSNGIEQTYTKKA
ncbi:metallophosphoesterase [Listeria booriae]|uniref:Serine/threonine protein phosphatase n=1 Tax=Listeria booriae TaxID=1552123 RepID=A0A099W3X5_9LIST|nr:metallophosphoesterase [Listeria booriae]KGL39717.1 serine/threonine protein phosphatase [Listeria booriae]MBC2205355.1 serine/threonine protein phosphatase [Listeria booriae]STY40231.1 Serine/threonine-protein phosphatase 1 [Listeria booriae]